MQGSFGLIEEHGRGRLEKIAEVVTKARTNAERRSIDRANRPYNSSITKSNTPQEVPATTTSQGPQPHNKDNTPRFDSWELLCKGTQRRYPTTNDIFHSPNYARQQGNLNSKLQAETNEKCRICKLSESEGRPREKLYMGHFGNFPNHCPQWASMNIERK